MCSTPVIGVNATAVAEVLKPGSMAYTGEAVHDHEIPRSGKCGTSGRGTYEYGAAVAGACYTGEAVQDHEIPRSGSNTFGAKNCSNLSVQKCSNSGKVLGSTPSK